MNNLLLESCSLVFIIPCVIGAKLMFMDSDSPSFSQHQDQADPAEEQRQARQA
jgi:hypothetical protein